MNVTEGLTETTLHRAKWVLPITSPPVENGAVAVTGGIITWVGPYTEARSSLNITSKIDHGEAVLLPGLINCHTHLDNSALKGKVTDNFDSIIDWIEKLLEESHKLNNHTVRKAFAEAVDDLIRYGTIAFTDIVNPGLDIRIPEHKPVFPVLLYEVRGFNRSRAAENIELALTNLEMVNSRRAHLKASLAIHGPHSLHRDVLTRVVEICRGQKSLMSIHLAESEEEVSFLKGESREFEDALRRWGFWETDYVAPGVSPVKYLDDLGILGPDLLAVHCVHLSDDDTRTLAKRDVSVCLCPRSNEFIGVGQPAIDNLRKAGIRLCLGTDGLASVNSLSMFGEMRFISERHSGIEPAGIFKMATIEGARALGLDSQLGSLEAGKTARFLVYHQNIKNNPYETLVNGVDHELLEWVGG